MMSVVADLHTHSHASDGVDSPARVAERAAEARLTAFALTDHDTTAGLRAAGERARTLGIGFVPGIELTCYHQGREIHILGYDIDPDDRPLLVHCEMVRESRLGRARLIGQKLAEAGVPVDMQRVIESADGGNVGRAHVAKALLDAGHVRSWEEAFLLYLGDGCPANVPKPDLPPEQALALIHNAGGSAFIAHPSLGNQWDLIEPLYRAGLDGIEAFHPHMNQAETEKALALAIRFDLPVSGGSDCHGALAGRSPALGTCGLDTSRWGNFRRFLGRPRPVYPS